jgi:cation diffusion facilitator family transporter
LRDDRRVTSGAADERPSRHLAVALLSFVVAVVLLAVKFFAYSLTESQAIFSDALESIVNVVAAAVAVSTLAYARQPADRDHPFGHGKVEFFSAAFEGGLILCAALMILWQAGAALVAGVGPRELDLGLVLTFGAGLANGALGVLLVRYGRRHHSAALEADGQHVLSDFWTSMGVVLGLLAVRITGLSWLDPLIAALMALWLLLTGFRLVRRAADGLLDAEDPELLRQLVAVLEPRLGNGIIRLHHLRAIRSGPFRHISAHLVVPEFWSVQQAHDTAETLAGSVLREMPGDGDVVFHTDPCERLYCSWCDLEACSVRRHAFVQKEPLTVDEVVLPDGHARDVVAGASTPEIGNSSTGSPSSASS